MRILVAAPWATMAVEVDDPSTAAIVSEAYASMGCCEGPSTPDLPIVVRVRSGGDGLVEVTSDFGIQECAAGMTAAIAVATELNRVFLDSCPFLAIHAAVLGTPTGSLAMPADSGIGKSTLAGACAQRGFTYLSDEALALTPTGMVVPYPRPLGLSPWSLAALGLPSDGLGLVEADEALVNPLTLGPVEGASSASSARIRAVLIPRRGPGGPSLTPLPRSVGAMALLRNSFNHYQNPAGSVALIHEVLAGAEVHELLLGDPGATAGLLAEAFGA